jgi:3-deoxy-D-manno-octulosonic-acid transferase
LFYFPLVRLLDFFFLWHPKILERNRFEKKNKFEWLAHSFSEIGVKADLCFEFSSEGEYQQVASLIDDALKAGKKIELVFFSPSVEKTIMRLAGRYPDQIRYLRYPLARIFPFISRRSFTHWVTSKTLIMVRYDLFPEFLLWGMKEGHTLKMIWMTFKKERSQGRAPSWLKLQFLKASETIVYAGAPDQIEGKGYNCPGEAFDFRMEQIRRRIELRHEKFREAFPLYPDFQKLIGTREKKLILGNAWPSDLFLLKNLPADFPIVIVPHQLHDENLKLFRDGLKNLGRDFFEINNQTSVLSYSSTYLINMKGILCELYADFPFAYVGGGFEASIHSVLEPLIAGSHFISCGPCHHRSTEFDVGRSWEKVSEINTPEQFMAWLTNKNSPEHARMVSGNYEKMRELVISC